MDEDESENDLLSERRTAQQALALRTSYRHVDDTALLRIREKYALIVMRNRMLDKPHEHLEIAQSHLCAINELLDARQRLAK